MLYFRNVFIAVIFKERPPGGEKEQLKKSKMYNISLAKRSNTVPGLGFSFKYDLRDVIMTLWTCIYMVEFYISIFLPVSESELYVTLLSS